MMASVEENELQLLQGEQKRTSVEDFHLNGWFLAAILGGWGVQLRGNGDPAFGRRLATVWGKTSLWDWRLPPKANLLATI